MIPFASHSDSVVAVFEQAEADILVQLASEVQGLLGQSDSVDPDSPSARALGRLLPAAYRDGGENDDEFRRFTAEGLIDRKTRNAAVVTASLADGQAEPGRVRVTLDAAGIQSWLRCITDIRLTLAAGLGIEQEGDERLLGDDNAYALEVYGWLGFVQESLLDAMDY